MNATAINTGRWKRTKRPIPASHAVSNPRPVSKKGSAQQEARPKAAPIPPRINRAAVTSEARTAGGDEAM
jgi:hypothetical protein